MPIAATVLFAREDFSIPGAPDPVLRGTNGAAAERRFFDLLQGSKPDVVLLDLSRANGAAVETILKIRRKSLTPILVVCDVSHPSADDYKSAGAADCIPAPVDILRLNRTLQQIIAGPGEPRGAMPPEILGFAGLTFRPQENALIARTGARAKLTASENRLLLYLASAPRVLRTRAQIGELLHGRYRPAGDRAVDIVVNRLRRKLASLCGPAGQDLVKTEFRRGYLLAADVSAPSALADAAAGQ